MFENIASKDSHLILNKSIAVDKVKQLIKDTILGRNDIPHELLPHRVEDLVDELIPSSIGLASQKGQFLRSKILSSAFHQLGNVFDNSSPEYKK